MVRKTPIYFHLSETYPPLGALGYVDAAKELLDQYNEFDVFVVASGSAATHAGLLAGLSGSGLKAVVIVCCVRRDAALQGPRINKVLERLADFYSPANNVIRQDIHVWDGALAPSYGRIGPKSLGANKLMASQEGFFLIPFTQQKAFLPYYLL